MFMFMACCVCHLASTKSGQHAYGSMRLPSSFLRFFPNLKHPVVVLGGVALNSNFHAALPKLWSGKCSLLC